MLVPFVIISHHTIYSDAGTYILKYTVVAVAVATTAAATTMTWTNIFKSIKKSEAKRMERETKMTIATALLELKLQPHNIHNMSFKECRCPVKMTRDEEHDDGNRGMKLGNHYYYYYCYYFIWHKNEHTHTHTFLTTLIRWL